MQNKFLREILNEILNENVSARDHYYAKLLFSETLAENNTKRKKYYKSYCKTPQRILIYGLMLYTDIIGLMIQVRLNQSLFIQRLLLKIKCGRKIQ